MSRVVFWIARFALDAFAYILAAVVAAAFIAQLFAVSSPDPANDPLQGFIALFVVLPIITVEVARDAFFPALVLILYAEWRALRDWLYYALCGVGTALVGALVFWWPGGRETPDAASLAMLCAAGAVAGIAYWLVAGRSAGVTRKEPVSRASTDA